MKTLNIYLIRHTEPLIDTATCYGQLDCGVADDYELQFEKVGEYFSDINIDAIYSSPLQRCALLAEDIAKQHINTPVIYEDAFQEIDFGDWEGLKWDHIARSKIDEWNENRLHFRFPNGETPQIFYDRVLSAWFELLSQWTTNSNLDEESEKSLLIVSHAGVIRTILSDIYAVLPAQSLNYKIDKSSISLCRVDAVTKRCIFSNLLPL